MREYGGVPPALMQLLIFNVRVALGAARLSTIACLSEAGMPSGLIGAEIQQLAGRNAQQRSGLAVYRRGRFSVRPSPAPVVIRAGPASRRRRSRL
jgi:hypothetical protein